MIYYTLVHNNNIDESVVLCARDKSLLEKHVRKHVHSTMMEVSDKDESVFFAVVNELLLNYRFIDGEQS